MINKYEKLKNIRLFVFDLEGTIVSNDCSAGIEDCIIEKIISDISAFIEEAEKAGAKAAIITGRDCDKLTAAVSELNLEIITSTIDKVTAADGLLNKFGLTYEQTAYAGDEILDLPLLGKAGLKLVPSTARREVKRVADIVMGEPENLLAELKDMLIKTGSDNPDDI